MKEIVRNRIEQFLQSWKDNNHMRMYELTSKTWMSKNSKKKLKQLLPKRIKSYKIESIEVYSECIYDVNIILRISGKTKNVTARMLCELDAFKPSLDGEFGVNPISIIRNLY